jgi:hypothetical protein
LGQADTHEKKEDREGVAKSQPHARRLARRTERPAIRALPKRRAVDFGPSLMTVSFRLVSAALTAALFFNPCRAALSLADSFAEIEK